jgi:hypothetical protein
MSSLWRFFWRLPRTLRYTTAMQMEDFILIAYAVTFVLIGALCLATWKSARTAKRQLGEK